MRTRRKFIKGWKKLFVVPPVDVQKKIVDECAKIDEEYNSTRMAIEEYRAKIEKLFADLEIIGRAECGRAERD